MMGKLYCSITSADAEIISRSSHSSWKLEPMGHDVIRENGEMSLRTPTDCPLLHNFYGRKGYVLQGAPSVIILHILYISSCISVVINCSNAIFHFLQIVELRSVSESLSDPSYTETMIFLNKLKAQLYSCR
uniref:Uncharacterized protein n=1 Tax=Kalanchoe fedtschenkoi TaxID=63787 RepID=A0A7N0TQM9_KALFE